MQNERKKIVWILLFDHNKIETHILLPLDYTEEEETRPYSASIEHKILNLIQEENENSHRLNEEKQINRQTFVIYHRYPLS